MSREGQPRAAEGFVPWFHLVAVKDPEHQAVAQQPGSRAGSWHDIRVHRSGGGTGALLNL